MAEKTTIEIAVVGPDTRCLEDPNRAATIGVTIAVYSPYSGGRPAIVANAMPWGRTMTAPVSPARKSSFRESFVTILNQARKGKIISNFIKYSSHTIVIPEPQAQFNN
jgi:hypothetical protein